jgi:hypothetical protein
MQVKIPEFYIAFVLSDHTQPSADEYEKLQIFFSALQSNSKELFENLLAVFNWACLLHAVNPIRSPFASTVEVQFPDS